MSVSAAPSYTPGDLSRLLSPSVASAPIIAATLAKDPTFFGYVKPPKSGRPASRKSAKGGGKFSEKTLAKRAHGKKEDAKKQQERHHKEVAEAASRKKAEKEARSASGRPKVKEGEEKAEKEKKEGKKSKLASAPSAAAAEEEDDGVDDSDAAVDDDDNEAAIESFMADLEKEEAGDDAGSSSEDEAGSADPVAKAKADRIAKRDARLAEDASFETRPQNKKEVARRARESRENDPRIPRTIFVGNVPTQLKSHALGVWIEGLMGIDLTSGKQKSIIESVRYRSVALSDPKVPRRAAVQKGLFHESRDSLNAYVVFTEESFVERALKEVHGKEIELEGKKWKVRLDRVHSAAEGSDSSKRGHDNSLSLFVGNLPFSVNENELYALFAPAGAVDSVRIVRDSMTGMGRGIAFVTFEEAQAVRNGLALNGTKFGQTVLPDGKTQGGREIRVMRAVENKKLHGSAPAAATKSGAASKAGGGTAASSSGKNSTSSTPRDGFVPKVKEMNRAGVMKKPRHKPRDGSASAAATTTVAPSASAAASSSSRPISASRIQGVKRSFEGTHSDPSEHVKRARVEDAKKSERKEKKRENKKISSGAGAGSNKKMSDS